MTPINQKYLTISKAAKLVGVTTKTLRRWEERGLLKPHRNAYQQRLYDPILLQSLKDRKYQPLPSHPSIISPHLKPGEAAKTLGISIKTLRRWEKSKKLTCVRNHLNQRVFNRQEVNQLKYLLSKKPTTTIYAPINQFYTPYLAPFLLLILYLPLVSLLIHASSLPNTESNLSLSFVSPTTPIKNPENRAFQATDQINLPENLISSDPNLNLQITNQEILPTPSKNTSTAPAYYNTVTGLGSSLNQELPPQILPDNLPISNFSLPSSIQNNPPVSL